MSSIASTQSSTNTIVTLNIGGTLFSTTKATLIENSQHNYFHGLLNESINSTKDLQGNYFIDRDPTHFRYILNQLRDNVVSLPQDTIQLNELLMEAKFFSVSGLVVLIETKLKQYNADYKNMKSNEYSYTVVEIDASTLEEVLMKHTGDGWSLQNVVPVFSDRLKGQSKGRNAHHNQLVFKKQLSNGQASLLTSLMSTANR
jgi:hypothetical protein|tara:strand:+ start:79 stop:681 length:603 start_codon:yes stop_codon:yes gene_type:complete